MNFIENILTREYDLHMDTVTLGKTGITVCKNGFGALPIQRLRTEDAVYLVRKAFDGGITFFDTARAYSDSEHKLSIALEGIRDKVYVATKTASTTLDKVKEDLETSLRTLKTDYIDIYQFHNPSFCPKDSDDIYSFLLQAKKEGKIRHIGITNHRLDVASEAIESGLYETLQFPFSYISGEKEKELVKKCREKDIGFIAMKGLSGGLLTNSRLCYGFMAQFGNVLPIWGVQREKELDEWLSYNSEGVTLTDEMKEEIEKDRKELGGEFCRGCGYCLPCPRGIQINQCARMIQLIRRSPSESQLGSDGREMMRKIKECVKCGQCMKKCPYSLPIPTLLEKNLKDYEDILSGRLDVKVTRDARL